MQDHTIPHMSPDQKRTILGNAIFSAGKGILKPMCLENEMVVKLMPAWGKKLNIAISIFLLS